MSTSNALRSRVSRETRQLLAAALIALLALWVLARIRYPGQPVEPEPDPVAALPVVGRPALCKPRRRDRRTSGQALDDMAGGSGLRGGRYHRIRRAAVACDEAAKQRGRDAAPQRRSSGRSSERHRDRSRDGAHPHSYRRRQRARGRATVDAPCARQSHVLHGHGGHIRWRVAATCAGRLAARDAKPGVAWSHLVGAGRDRPHDILVRLYDVGRDRRSRGTRAGWSRDRPVGHRARRSDAHSRWWPCVRSPICASRYDR